MPLPLPSLSSATIVETVTVPSRAAACAKACTTPPVAVAPPGFKKQGRIIDRRRCCVCDSAWCAVSEVFCFGTRSRSSGAATNVQQTSTRQVVASAPKEVSRYWLELEPARRWTKNAGCGDWCRSLPVSRSSFHFTFAEEGYLYIVGPGDKNQPTAFLTTKPSPATGLTTNKVSKGVEFSFPKGDVTP